MEQSPVVASKQITQFPTFHGFGSEFFRIWIVNVLLTVVTCGIYSAWAKVRTLKYMFGATELEGARFGFHGEPIPILKGRIIAAFLGVIYLFGASISLYVTFIGIVLIFFLMPFIFVKSLKFRLANTSYRNIRFSFRGKIAEAYSLWFKYMIPIFLYLIFNLVAMYFIEQFKANPGAMGSWKTVGSLFFGLAITFIVIYSIVILPNFYNRVLKYFYSNSYYGGNKLSLNSSDKEFKTIAFFPVIVRYIGLIVTFVVLVFLITFAIKAFNGAAESSIFATSAAVTMILPLYLGMFAIVIYGLYLVKNYIWNRLTLSPNHETKSKLKFLEYFKISFVNAIGVILTLGLFFPWAKMRSKKYLIENRGIKIDDFDKFTSDAESNISALGEEVVDAFDFDFELGL